MQSGNDGEWIDPKELAPRRGETEEMGMKMKFVTGLVLVLGVTAIAQAEIIGWNCDDDGDGAIVMNSPTWTALGPNAQDIEEYRLEMHGAQHWYPAHVEGDFTTDTELDPVVWIVEQVDNYTDFTWTDYHIDIGMNKEFSIIGVVAPADWTWTITPPVGGQPIPNGGTGWLGSVDYYAGTPIEIGQSGQFGLVISFAGSVEFCTEQIPTPEPASLVLLALGALMLRRR